LAGARTGQRWRLENAALHPRDHDPEEHVDPADHLLLYLRTLHGEAWDRGPEHQGVLRWVGQTPTPVGADGPQEALVERFRPLDRHRFRRFEGVGEGGEAVAGQGREELIPTGEVAVQG